MEYRYLGNINSPNDIKQLNIEQLNELCAELRSKIISTVSKNGGHLASNLGSVELTVALHKAFNSPDDTIIFDVGHQCYPHKLLTGRYNDFTSLRQNGGISGFMKPEESEHDAVITGHSSTSVSSAFGICFANELSKNNNYSIAVIGDGALTGGMVYEAFNNVRKKDANLIVVLNDNKMSISRNKGALAKHLSTIRMRKKYIRFKSGVERFLKKIPIIGHYLFSFIFHLKLMVKNALYNSNIFESLGFYYMGPVDGHDIKSLITAFEVAKELNRPVLIHTKTVKGKGYAPAENNPGAFHGVSGFNADSGELPVSKMNFSSVFGQKLTELAEKDEKICAITAAMTDGTGLKAFSTKFPERFVDVGIAEEHAVTFSAGLAKCGYKPVFAVYSTFLQRGYDQIIHDAAIAGLPLTLAIDRAGLVGDDGETHQGIFDVAYLSSIPGMTILAPATFDELRVVLEARLSNPNGIAAIRYPRGGECVFEENPYKYNGYSKFGDGYICLLTYGVLCKEVIAAKNILAKDGISTCVIKLDKIFPIENDIVSEIINCKNIFFFEEGIINGGIAQKIGNILLTENYKGSYKCVGIDGFVKQATVDIQRSTYGLDRDSIVKLVKEVINIE